MAIAAVVGAVVAVSVGSGGGTLHPRTRTTTARASVTEAPRARPSATRLRIPVFAPDPRAVTLANRLPLASQVAQLFMVSVNGTTSSAPAGLGPLDWGGVVLDSSNDAGSAAEVGVIAQAIAAGARGAKRTPPLIAATQEGGPQTAIRGLAPESEPTMAASGRPSVARSQALLSAHQLHGLNIDMTLAPLADVDIPDGALSGRLFSGDPGTVSRFAAAALAGYSAGHLIAAVGHFPGAGAASADPDQMTATVGGTLAQLRARDLVPFAAVVRSAPVIVMSNASYVAFDGVTPAGLLREAVTLLRGAYHFGGVVMSDDLDATLQPTGSTPGSVALQALQAGDDLLYITGPPSEHQAAYAGVLAAAQRDPAVRTLVHEALLRVLTLKARYRILGR